MTIVKLEQVEQIASSLAKKRPSFNQLICDFTQRPAGKLEKCLSAVDAKYKGRPLYTTLTAKASILFYLMNKLQPFAMGNKRIALATLLYFLSSNNKWLKVEQEKLFELASWVSLSPDDAKDELVVYIEKFIKKHLVELNDK